MGKEIYTYKELEEGEGVKIPVDKSIRKHKAVRVRFKNPPKTFEISNPRVEDTKAGLFLFGNIGDDPSRIRGIQAKGIVWAKPLCEHWKYGTNVLCPEADIWAIDEEGRPKRFKV